jgi:hypothetical protein
MDLVRLDDPTNMNVLGLLLGGFLQHVLQDTTLAERARRLRGNVCLKAGSMWTTLCFDGRGVEVVRGKTASCKAVVEGEMHDLLRLVTGGGVRGMATAVGPFLRRRLRVRGDLLFLLRMMPILTGGS